MKYYVTIHNYDRMIGTYTTNNTYIEVSETINHGLLKRWRIRIHIACAEINCKYLPANRHIQVTYNGDDLLIAAISELRMNNSSKYHIKFCYYCIVKKLLAVKKLGKMVLLKHW